MANPRKSLQGRTFGHLKAKAYAGKNEYGNSLWDCQCKCGSTVVVAYQHLTAKAKGTKSCGCMLGKWPRKSKKSKS